MNAATLVSLSDYRRQVADLYAGLRAQGVDESSWHGWRSGREQLLLTHPQSALIAASGARLDPPRYYPYDPAWQVVARVDPADEDHETPPLTADDGADFSRIATARFDRLGVEHSLTIYSLNGYAGGLFVPFRDETNGDTTYGGGRYALDTAKSFDLGQPPGQSEDDVLLLDFNFAHHPSCAWDPKWQCPLAPPENHMAVAVEAGERYRARVGPLT